MDAAACYQVLMYEVLQWISANSPDGNYVRLQGRIHLHTAVWVRKFLEIYFANFWPPSLPGLSPLDFSW